MIYQNFVNAYEETFEDYCKIVARAGICLARISQGFKVLDAGCGNGSVSEILAERSAQVYGIDLSPSMISRAKLRKLENSVFLHGDCLALPFEDRFFDFYLGNLLINNVKNPAQLITEANRVLKEGGKLVISHPLHNSPNDILKIMKNALRQVKIGAKSQKPASFHHLLDSSLFKNIRTSTVTVGLNLRSGAAACKFLAPLKEVKQLDKVSKKQEVLEIIEKLADFVISQGNCLVFEVCLITAEKAG